MAKETKDSVKKSSINSKTTSKKSVTNAPKTKSKRSNSTEKKDTTKKTTSKKATAKKTTTKKANIAPKFQSEYYDLPYNYNKTVIKILAQTPSTLFVYWEVSDKDRNRYKELYGENFFETTKPVLIIYNDTLNYSFEVEINDFANSWYLHIDDSKCDYRAELGRKPIPSSPNKDTHITDNSSIPYYVYISSSNKITSPNDEILFNLNPTSVKFQNIKTNKITEKKMDNYKFISNVGTFNIKDLYNNLHILENFNLNNPSSGNFN